MEHSTLFGTISGTLLVIVGISNMALIQTCVLAALGAVVSFCVSVILKYLYKKYVTGG